MSDFEDLVTQTNKLCSSMEKRSKPKLDVLPLVTNSPPVRMSARDVPAGQCLRKLTGSHRYLKMSESAVEFLGLDKEKVYGVGYNGNVTVVRKGTKVLCEDRSMMVDGVVTDKELYEKKELHERMVACWLKTYNEQFEREYDYDPESRTLSRR